MIQRTLERAIAKSSLHGEVATVPLFFLLVFVVFAVFIFTIFIFVVAILVILVLVVDPHLLLVLRARVAVPDVATSFPDVAAPGAPAELPPVPRAAAGADLVLVPTRLVPPAVPGAATGLALLVFAAPVVVAGSNENGAGVPNESRAKGR